MRHNPYIAVLIFMSIMLAGLISISGCRKAATAPAARKDVVTTKEAAVNDSSPFQDAARKTVTAVSNVAREQPSILSADSLSRLHISGLALLFVAVAARFLFGRWKDAYIATGLGVVPSVLAVLLTEYSRVVLLVPLCGLVILGVAAYRRIATWRMEAKGFEAASVIIEKADTGPKSLGQLMKDRIAESGVSGVVDKALKPLEAQWAKTK